MRIRSHLNIEQIQIHMLYCIPEGQSASNKRSFAELNEETSQDLLMPALVKKISQQPVLQSSKSSTGRPQNYSQIPECPTIQLTDKMMQGDPLRLFTELEIQYEKFGAVKLMVSQGWNPPFTFRYIDKGITVRIQKLNQLNLGKSFEQRIQAYSIKGYEDQARKFDAKYKYRTNPKGNTLEDKDEEQFWALVNNPQFKDLSTKVEYAADLPVSKYGSGFPLMFMPNWRDADFEYETNLFNLNNTYKSANSLLKIAGPKSDKISGVTSPWMYMGMKFASFCWHVEDLYINSLNYNHKGATKTWYIVPKSNKDKFDQFVQKRFAHLLQSKPDLLHRITLMIDPMELVNEDIQVYKIKQEHRCYVITFSKVYHGGFSHGFNVGEAVNYVTPLSYRYIAEANQEYEKFMGKKMAIFPTQWLIHQNYLSLDKIQNSESYRQFIIQEYNKLLEKELELIKHVLQKYSLKQYSYIAKKNLKYDKNVCSLCKNYVYLSFLKCNKCLKNHCLHHAQGCCSSYRLWLRQPQRQRKIGLQTILNTLEILVQD